MSLSQFPTTMPAAVTATIQCAAAIRHVRNASGDLTFRDLNAVQEGLRSAKVTTYAALSEGAKAPAAAQAFMAGLGGPETLADYQAKAMDIEAKATAWNVFLADRLASLPAESLIALVTRPDSMTRHIERPAFISAIHADPLRQSPELADLLAAFEAVGA